MPNFWSDQVGTTLPNWQIGIEGALFKYTAGGIDLRNAADTANLPLTALRVNNTSDELRIGTAAGANFLTLNRNPGQTTPLSFIWPISDGAAGQVLAKKSGSPANTIELEWYSAGATGHLKALNQSELAFGSTGTGSMFTLPALATFLEIEVIVDEAFNGSPSLSVGITGQTSKYLPANRVSLKTAGQSYLFHPNIVPVSSSEPIIWTFAAGGATSGAARIISSYCTPI